MQNDVHRRFRFACWTLLLLGCLGVNAYAAPMLQISLGIRETGTTQPIGSDGGVADGIEWVNLDGQAFTANGAWQTFTFTPSTDPLTAFAGTTADSLLSSTTGTIEHIRFRIAGDVGPWTIFIDDVQNTTSAGTTVITGFEGFAVGSEVMFQEPRFSGSTSSNLEATPDFAGVSDEQARTGSQSYKIEFEFVDDDPAKWIRLTTFGMGQEIPNPAVVFDEVGTAFAPTISFSLLALPRSSVPEPGTLALLGLGLAGLAATRRRRQ